MTEDALRQAIQQPLIQHPDAKDKRFEDALLDRLASDAAADAAYLPLLQVTLERLWAGGLLKLSAYNGLAAAIQQQAEEVYTYRPDGTPRPEAERQAILALLLELVDVSPTDDDRRDVRRRRTLDELLHADPERRGLVTELATARLLSTGRETRAGAEVEVVDIIHESLLSNWARLKQAIDAERETLQQRARFEMALHEWQANEQQDAYLLMGVRLSEAEALDAQGDVALRNAEAQELLKRSRGRREQERQKRIRNQRRVIAALSMLLLLAIGAAWFAFDRQQAAVAETERAEQEATIALSRQIAAQSVSLQESDPRLALLLATQADAITSTFESRDSLLTGLQSTQFDATLFGHTSWVSSVAFSPDGQTLASASCGEFVEEDTWRCIRGEIILWEVATEQQIGEPLQGHTSEVLSVAFSPDGTTLASGSWDQTIILWDVASGQPRGDPLLGHTSTVNSVAFSPDGTTLASASGFTIRLWDVASGQPIGDPLQGHTSVVESVAFSPDSTMLASASADQTIRLWEVATGQPIGDPLTGHTSTVNSVAFSPDGITLASGSFHSTIRLWDVTTGQPIGDPLTGHTDAVWSVAFSPDGITLVSGSQDGTIRLWDVATGQQRGDPLTGGHASNVRSVAFSPDGTTLASTSGLSRVDFFDA
jgi:WD40 repeat protein